VHHGGGKEGKDLKIGTESKSIADLKEGVIGKGKGV